VGSADAELMRTKTALPARKTTCKPCAKTARGDEFFNKQRLWMKENSQIRTGGSLGWFDVITWGVVRFAPPPGAIRSTPWCDSLHPEGQSGGVEQPTEGVVRGLPLRPFAAAGRKVSLAVLTPGVTFGVFYARKGKSVPISVG